MDRARWRFTVSHAPHPRLRIGLEFNPLEEELGPLLTWFLATETERSPAVFLGTSSDRIGSPSGEQAYFATLTKTIPGTTISPYVTLNYSEWDEAFNLPFGAHLGWGPWFAQPMYDGDRSHLVGGYQRGRFTVSALWIWYEDMGMALSYGL